MSNCGCSRRCDCVVIAGDNITVAGDGGTGTPYVISATGGGAVTCDQVRPCLSAGPGATYDPVTGVIAANVSTDAGNQVTIGTDDGLFVPAGGGAVTALAVTDTPSVDLELTGTGAAGDPYTVAADVVLDPAPPGGGTNLLHESPDGLFVECADVRTCLSAGPGATYDSATGVIGANVSPAAGNQVAINPDGGLFVPAGGAGGTALAVTDTTTVDLGLTGTGAAGDPYTVTADVILDPAPPGGGTNLLKEGPDGLFVECDTVRTCLSAGDGIEYDPDTGEISAFLSEDPGNQVEFGSDRGLFVPPGGAGGTALAVTDTPTVDLGLTGDGSAGDPYTVTADVILDPAPPGGGTNLLKESPDGLFVECADVRTCLSAGDGAAYDPATGVITARLSGDAGNQVEIGGDGGLFVPAGGAGGTALAVTDTDTVDLGLTGTGAVGDPYTVTADVVLDPAPPGGGANLLKEGPDGLFVECADVRTCLSAGDGATYDPATGVIAANVSPAAGNQVVINPDGGLFVPTGGGAATALAVTDTDTVDLELTGTGAPGDPYTVAADVVLDPAPPGGGANLLHEGPDGLFVECADVRTCLSAGNGAAYDPTTGAITARLSGDAGNQVAFGGDGGLYAPPAASAALEVSCGLAGNGSAGAPLAAAVTAWPYPCDLDAQGGLVYCDSTGTLRSEPRAKYQYFTTSLNELIPGNPAVPTTTTTGGTTVATRTLDITNPDPCRPAIAITSVEVDVDFVIPPGGRAGHFVYGDEMYRFENRGSATVSDVHTQTTKVVGNTTIPPGGTVTVSVDIGLGFGAGGATYNRVQSFIRAMVFAL
ncbi:hypothetical protein AB0F88_16840 [Streptosporangium sp. NPDC023963]|uniref:hypothetical protein n=1 Tax=Streptosporangium sp. NPDC023963 TaxID=3155608 RepID=UPI00342BAF24